MSKVVFVGNVPYNMAEEQIEPVFKSVGQVVGLRCAALLFLFHAMSHLPQTPYRLVYDRETGKAKGYGFCEFADHETALSAVRNLNGHELGGRALRIDLADSDPFLEGKTTVRGEIVDGGETRAQWRERNERERYDSDRPGRGDGNSFLASVPKGVPLPSGSNALDAISHVLATTDPSQILEVLAQIKAFVITHTDQARALLGAHPQLGYAVFQALLLHNIVDPAILNRMLAATGAAAAPPAPAPAPAPPAHLQHGPPPPYMSAPAPPPMSQPQPSMYPSTVPPPSHTPVHHPTPPIPPPNMYGQPPPQMQPPSQMQPPPYYRPPAPPAQVQAVPTHPQQLPPPLMAPAPPMHAQPPPAPPGGMPGFDEAQRDMLMQVLRLTPEQMNSLPPKEREAIMQLRHQFGYMQ
ncbi:hypothetical protein C8Q80DRAFT_1249777 [Daedaleopsis nitida]|nr:hypothetical protein C8Q80DRAFT_1249777 [Daedaleopsis nitida]